MRSALNTSNAILNGEFEDGSGYAINLVRPAGVRYLDPPGQQALSALLLQLDADVRLPSSATLSGIERPVAEALDLTGQGAVNVQIGRHAPKRTLSTWIHVSN